MIPKNKIELVMEDLKTPGVIYKGTAIDSPEEFHINRTWKELKFVVVVGHGKDWCVYVESYWKYMSYESVARVGDKVFPSTLKDSGIIIASDEVWERYRL